MSSDNVTHIGVKIDTAPIKEFKKLVKSDKGGNLITDIAGAFMALEEIINRMTKGGLKNQVKYLEESTQIMIRSFEALAKVSVDTERIKQSKAQSGKRAARRRPTRKVLRDEADTVIALQGNLNTLKQLISYGEEHIQQIEKIDTFEQRTFAMKQAQAKLLKQQILDEDKLLEIQEQKEKAERDLSKLEEGSLEYDQKKLEVLEADVRLRQEKHKLLRKADVDTLDEVAKANYEMELKVSRANILTSKELVKEQEKQIRNQQKITKETERTKQSVGKIIKDFFSMEKLIARMSFVLTAKLSYELFDTIARLPKQSLNLWREFSDEMSKVFSLIADESDRTKKRLQNDVIELSKTYGIAAKELSGALYEIISAQVGVANASKVLNEAIKLSLAGGADVRTSAQSLVQIINAYDMGFDQVQRVADVAFQTVKYGQLTLQQYTDQMSKVVATASLLKIPIEEVSAAIATMTINGIKSEQAFTALNQMLMTIAIPTERSKELMEQLGINLSISDIQAKGMGAALSELIPMLSMTGEANEELIGILFKNRTGFKAVASLLQNMGQYTENYARMIDSAGASHDALAQRVNTVEFHANRLRTAWDAFLMSFAEGKNEQIIGFYNRMANAVEIVSNNLDLVFLAIRMIGITILGQIVSKALPALLSGLKAVWRTVATLGTTFKVAWAEATLGLSLIITGLINVGMALSALVKRAGNAKLDEALGIRNLANDIAKLENQIKNLDRTIGQIDAVKRLVDQFENLYNAQKNVAGSQDKIAQGFNAMVRGLRAVGVDVRNITLETINFVDIISEVMKQSEKMTARRLKLQSLMAVRESQAQYGEAIKARGRYAKHPKGTPSNPMPDLREIRNLSAKLYEAVSGDADEGLIEFYIEEIRDKSSRYAEKLLSITQEQFNEFSKKSQKAIDTSIEYLVDTEQSMHSLAMTRGMAGIIDIDKLGAERTVVSFKDRKEGEFSDKLKSILQRLVGDRIFENLEEVQEAVNEELDVIKDEMQKFEKDKGVITDKEQAEKFIALIEGMVSEGVMIDIVKARDEYLAYQIDTMKKMREAGREGDALILFRESINIWDNFNEIISGAIDKIDDFSGDLSESELRNLKNSLEKSVLGNPIEMLVAIGEVLSPKEYLKLISERIPKEFGLPEQGISSLKELDVLMAEAEDAGMTGFANILQLFKEAIIRGLESALELDLNITPEDEAFSVVKSVISKGMAQGKIASVSDLNKAIADIESRGVALDKSQKTELRKMLGGGWKDVLGIEEYEKGHDATIDIANKTVATLSQVWDFYWDVELRKMQEQQDKKLKILNHEKDMMLANTNISNEQRAVLEQRYQEEQAKLQEEYEKKAAKQKKKKAIFDATIDYAKGLIALWSAEVLNPVKAGILSALLSGIFATQMAMINNQKYASGGFTGSGYGRPDETGHKPAGIVHAGELVFTKDMVNKNFAALSGLFGALKSGKSFDAYAMSHIAGNTPMLIKPSKSGSYASGGLVGNAGIANLNVNLSGLRVIDDVSLAKLVMRGNKKMRLING